jgi:hypothetical protein
MNLSMRRAASKSPSAAIFESEERQALAAAIERRNLVQRELDATSRALSEIQEKRRDVRRAVDAKANAVTFLTATINGTAGEAPMSGKDARAALQEAEDVFETQRTLEESLSKEPVHLSAI